MQYDPDNDGLNYVTVAEFRSPNHLVWEIGLPMVKTAIRGTGTNAYDHPINLKWAAQFNNAGWSAWQGQQLYNDNLACWHYERRSDTEYEVLADPPSPSC